MHERRHAVVELRIPTHPSELTPGWLTGILRDCGTLDKATVTAISSEVLGTGRGFTGQVMRLHLDYDRLEPTAPCSLIAKLPAADPMCARHCMLSGCMSGKCTSIGPSLVT